MKVVITKEDKDEAGNVYIPGLVLDLPDEEANRLKSAGTAAESDQPLTTDFGSIHHGYMEQKAKGG